MNCEITEPFKKIEKEYNEQHKIQRTAKKNQIIF